MDKFARETTEDVVLDISENLLIFFNVEKTIQVLIYIDKEKMNNNKW